MNTKSAFEILIAEDDIDDRLLIEKAFTKSMLNASIRYVENGVEVIDFLNKNAVTKSTLPNLILLDLNMPKMDGRETLKVLKKQAEWKKIPVIVFTTSKAEDDLIFTYENGTNSYIVKPSSFAKLVEIGEQIKQYWLNTVTLP